MSYTCNGLGLQESRTTPSGTQHFVWDSQSSVPLILSDGNESYLYGPSSTPVAQVNNASGSTSYLHVDNVGSVRLITSASGSVVDVSEYGPYGQTTFQSGTVTCAIGFTGNWTDEITGLVYLRARDYDPQTAQFLTIDSLANSTHEL